ncbi:MAG TPA: hypothetical protein PLJ13_15695, partial [Cyclobacteriaceae bacterium]|nr:hypothetical protein [Cyclobacteriaceae bacterium]
MSSREKILASVKKNQPSMVEFPTLNFAGDTSIDLKAQFIKTLTGIGGSVIEVNEIKEVGDYIKSTFPKPARIVNTLTDLN